MSRVTHQHELGFLPMQHHEDDVLTGMRYQIAGARLAKAPTASSDPNGDGLIEIATVDGKGTIGDMHPVGYWQTKGRDKRATGSWSPLFASLVSDVGSAPGQTTASPHGTLMRPTSGAWVQDVRYAEKEGAWPSGIQRMPKNTMSVAIFGTDETRQRDLMASVDPRLFAPTTEGPADCGTLLVDLQGTGEPCMESSSEPGVGGRAARLQSMLRVIPLNANSTSPIGAGPGNAIAWNLSYSRRDNLVGLGLVFAAADTGFVVSQPTTPGGSGPTTGGGGGLSQPITPGGGTYLPPPGFGQPGITTGSAPLYAAVQAGSSGSTGGGGSGGYSGPGDTVGYGDVSVHDSGHFIPKPQGAHAGAFVAALGGNGPIHVGNVADKHRHTVDRDGNPINAAHISTGAYYYADQQRDAPMLFEGFYPDPPQLPLYSRVHLSYDRKAKHVFRGKQLEGMWRWYAETHIMIPDAGDEPDDPQTPPITGEPAPEPPTTGGGGPPIPLPPTTGGGGGGGGPTTGGGGTGGPTGGPPTPPGGSGGGPGGSTPTTGGSGGTPGVVPTGGSGEPGPGESGGEGTGGSPGSDPADPDAPPEPTNPYGDEPQLKDGDDPVDINDPEQNPFINPQDLPRDEEGKIDHDKLDEWRPRHRRRTREWLRQMWDKHHGGGIPPGDEREDATTFIGEMSPNLNRLFTIFHPMNEGFAALNFRPQLMSAGYPLFEHNPNLGDLLPEDEKQRPQVLAAHAWGPVNADGDWDYQRTPGNSRARGGVANGGLLLHPPCMELEDYAQLAGEAMDTNQPLTTGYLAFAQGTCLGFGSPDFASGGLQGGGVSVGQDATSGNAPLFVMQSDSGGSGHTIAEFEYDPDDAVPRFRALGTGAMSIPRGTTAQRPNFDRKGGELRYNTETDRVEFFDFDTGAFIALLSSFGDDAVNLQMSTDRLLGRTTASTGNVEEIEIGTGLSLSSGVLSATGGGGGVIDATSGSPATDIAETSDSSSANMYSYTIPADTLASGKRLRITLLGAIVQNSGADQNARLRVRLGGTEYCQSAVSRANDTDPYGFRIVIDIAWTGSSSQYIRTDVEQAGAFSSASGYGNIGASTDGIMWALATEDNTASMLLEVRGTFDTTATSCSWATYSAQTELLG